MLLDSVAVKVVVVREPLRARALPDRDETVLLGVEDPALLSHRLGIGHRRREEPVPRDPAVQSGPVVVPVAISSQFEFGGRFDQIDFARKSFPDFT